MNKLQEVLDAAFKALDVIPVSGGGVELMAAARANLRLAYQMAGEEGKQGGELLPQVGAGNMRGAAT